MNTAEAAVVPANPYSPPATAEPMASAPQPVVDAIMKGTRFRTVPYTFSIVVMSFRRNMGELHEVKTGQWPTGQLFGAVLISLCFGWWGVPWGIAWTIQSLYFLWNGGRDHTLTLLNQFMPPAQAKQVLKASAKPETPPALWIIRLIILVPIVTIVTFFLKDVVL